MAELEVPETMHVESETHEPEHQEGERQLTQREMTMRAIAERAEARRQEEIAQGRVFDEEARAAGLAYEEDAPAEPEREPEPVEHIAAPEPTPAPEPAHEMRSVMFDGRQFEVSPEQYDELAKMGLIANLALNQYQQQAPAQQQQYQPQQHAPAAPMVDNDAVREVVRKIQYGGEEDGAQALTNLITGIIARQPQIDQQAIIHQAAAHAQAQAQFAQDQSIIQREYKDVFADPQRTMLARLNVDAIRNRNAAVGKYQSDLEVFREAGNMVLDALNLPRPNSQDAIRPAIQAAQVAPRGEILERKRAAPRTTTQVDRRAPAPPTPRAPTGSDVVEQMRRARGQTSMM